MQRGPDGSKFRAKEKRMNAIVKPELKSKTARRLGVARLLVRVRSVTHYGTDIRAYEISDPAGEALPAFEPGSHIDVYLPTEGLGIRQYSLCGDPEDRYRYCFAVQREASGRGGSKAIFEEVHVDSDLIISEPRNNFALRSEGRRHLLLAGGIGITPMMSMLYRLRRTGADFMLHYCTRSSERTAFLDQLRPLITEGSVVIHWDGGDPTKGFDIKDALQHCADQTHLYYCGPPGFMGVVAAASSHWPPGATHREFFTPSANDPAIAVAPTFEPDYVDGGLGGAFQVKIASTGQIFDVPSDKTILQVLRTHDIGVETACELGVCGTCRTHYLEGEPDHRDFVLEAEEQEREMTVCCSRSKSPLLVLDL
jgi:vanillate O-demethylase ferredoxin subunit